jgi:hypothetical protein
LLEISRSAAARLRHIAGTAWSTKRYPNIEPLKDQQMRCEKLWTLPASGDDLMKQAASISF